ncbi:hypothetical protein SLS54_007306 [Diplodia seriata]
MEGLKRSRVRRKAQFLITAAVVLVLSVLILRRLVDRTNFNTTTTTTTTTGSHNHHHDTPFAAEPPSDAPCPTHLPGADDIFIVLKTGATVAHAKVPIHLRTTFRCAPHFALFSDLDDIIDGHLVHDVFGGGGVPDAVKAAANDSDDGNEYDAAGAFELYDRLRAWQTARVDIAAKAANDAALRQQAWNLDKWKFLPLMRAALAHAPRGPRTRWFVFIEADTALMWSNLLRWLPRFDAAKAWYIGCPSWIAGSAFAHGGTGIILSRPALSLLVAALDADASLYPRLTSATWAGDYVLAQAMALVGVPLTPAFPIMQGETPWSLDYTKRHWCYPVVSWHHMTPEWVGRVWGFQQGFWGDGGGEKGWWGWGRGEGDGEVMRHYHVFEEFVAPVVRAGERVGWDNLSPEVMGSEVVVGLGGEAGKEGCRKACERTENCMQWLWDGRGDGTCKWAKEVRLGKEVEAVDGEDVSMTSGWIVERIDEFVESMNGCMMGDWIVE